jgi:hypothetical protein
MQQLIIEEELPVNQENLETKEVFKGTSTKIKPKHELKATS